MTLPWTPQQIGFAALVFVVSTLITTGIVAAFIVLIPPDHLVASERGVSRTIESPLLQISWRILKNLLGVVLVVVGVLLSFPGVPGQGLLTIFVGILMLDIPGKRGLELRIVRRPRIRKTMNRLRARFDRAPLELDDTEELTEQTTD